MGSATTVALPYLWPALEEMAARYPDKAAIIDGPVCVSYRRLVQAVPRLGERPPAGAVTTALLGNSAEDVVSLIGSALTGRDVLIADPRAPEFERARALEVATRPVGIGENGREARAEPAVLLTTSGVNGVPKVVRRSWSTITANTQAFASAAGYEPDDVVLCSTPLSHCYAFSVGLVAALSAGATVLLDRLPLAPDRLVALFGQHRVTVIQSVPFLYRWYLSSLDGGLSSLRLAISAGESLDDRLAAAWQERSSVPLSNHYGTTETGTVTLNRDGRCGGVGPPLDGVELRIDRPDDDGVGEVLVRCGAGAATYVGQPDMTAVAWDGPWYRSGDVGRLDREGALVITGRKSVRINVAGRKVDPVEVEDALRSCPGVHDCAVVGTESSTTGEEIVAHVVADDSFSWSATRASLAQRLSSYKVPRRVEQWSELPRTASGKVRRGLLQGGP